MDRYYDLTPMHYTVVDADGEHFGWGRTTDLNEALRGAETLNAEGQDGYAAPFRAVKALNMSGRIGEL